MVRKSYCFEIAFDSKVVGRWEVVARNKKEARKKAKRQAIRELDVWDIPCRRGLEEIG